MDRPEHASEVEHKVGCMDPFSCMRSSSSRRIYSCFTSPTIFIYVHLLSAIESPLYTPLIKMSNLVQKITAPNGVTYEQPLGLFINNKWTTSSNGQKIVSINPT